MKISDAVNKAQYRPYYIIGGHCPSPDPEYFMRKTKADAVVIGEGESTIIDLFRGIGTEKVIINS